MSEPYIHIDFVPGRTLQDQVREHLVQLIISAKLPLNEALPSSRRLSSMLCISRNTIVCAYEDLQEMGYLISVPRQGYFVAPLYHDTIVANSSSVLSNNEIDWQSRLKITPAKERNIVKPRNWSDFEYPFVYGQIQEELFPIKWWRECVKKSLSDSNGNWIHDWIDTDHPLLIEQIRHKILPKRGIFAQKSQILITIGTQNSLYLLANLLLNKESKVGLENPGFPDARNIFSSFGAELSFHDIDQEGICVDQHLKGLDYIYLTPSHQVPTGAVLSQQRRTELMSLADRHDTVIIEDDYDAEINMQKNPMPALKAMDSNERVIYIGSMSKSMSPGLRIGFMVADENLINEARALRRLMYRHPPISNQHQLALFLSQGYYDNYLRKIRDVYSDKLAIVHQAVNQHLPGMNKIPVSTGATALWLQANSNIDTERLSWMAAKEGILIEPGRIHYAQQDAPNNYFRLGFSAIATEKILPGIKALKRVIDAY